MKNRENIYKITSILLMLDQVIKLLVRQNINLNQRITVIPKFFYLHYVENTGAAFSILENNTTFIIIISVIFILLLDRYIKKETNFTKLSILSFGLILGGIFGNLIDRLLFHAVIDYLSFTFMDYSFPIFNVADMGISIGTFLLVIATILERKQELNKDKNRNV